MLKITHSPITFVLEEINDQSFWLFYHYSYMDLKIYSHLDYIFNDKGYVYMIVKLDIL